MILYFIIINFILCSDRNLDDYQSSCSRINYENVKSLTENPSIVSVTTKYTKLSISETSSIKTSINRLVKSHNKEEVKDEYGFGDKKEPILKNTSNSQPTRVIAKIPPWCFKNIPKNTAVDYDQPKFLVEENLPYEEDIRKNIEEAKILRERGDSSFITKKFNLIEELGKGSYGEVCLFTTKSMNICCAIKCTFFKHPFSSLLDEVEISEVLKKLNHKNIIQIYDMIPVNHLLYVFMEYGEANSLFYYVRHCSTDISDISKRNILSKLLDGIEFLHQHDIVHGDLSVNNILVDGKDLVKIIDFGFAKVLPKGEHIEIRAGVAVYLSPERIKGIYMRSCDLWSFGIILYFMYHYFLPIASDDLLDYVSSGDQPPWYINVYTPLDAQDLLEKMLRINLMERLGANDNEDMEIIKNHVYFKKSQITWCLNIIRSFSI